jgi:hypothetical protein
MYTVIFYCFLSSMQYGAPYNYDLYLHRLGRTGRAGHVGCGLLVLLPFESPSQWKNAIQPSDQFTHINLPSLYVETKVLAVQNYVRAGHPLLTPSAEAAYISFVAHYLGDGGETLDGTTARDAAEHLAGSFGLASVPSFPRDIQAKIKNKKCL